MAVNKAMMEVLQRIRDMVTGEKAPSERGVSALPIITAFENFESTGEHAIIATTDKGQIITIPLSAVTEFVNLNPIKNEVPQDVQPETIVAAVAQYTQEPVEELLLPVMETGFIPNIPINLYVIMRDIISVMPFSNGRELVDGKPVAFQVNTVTRSIEPLAA